MQTQIQNHIDISLSQLKGISEELHVHVTKAMTVEKVKTLIHQNIRDIVEQSNHLGTNFEDIVHLIANITKHVQGLEDRIGRLHLRKESNVQRSKEIPLKNNRNEVVDRLWQENEILQKRITTKLNKS